MQLYNIFHIKKYIFSFHFCSFVYSLVDLNRDRKWCVELIFCIRDFKSNKPVGWLWILLYSLLTQFKSYFMLSCYYTEIIFFNSCCLIRWNISEVVSPAFVNSRLHRSELINLNVIKSESLFSSFYINPMSLIQSNTIVIHLWGICALTFSLALQICAADFLSQQEEKKPGRCRSNQRRPQVANNFSAILIIDTENWW